jgi:hypothetical protein
MEQNPQTFGASSEAARMLNPLEISDWDRRVGALPGATFFHSQAWARVLNRTYGYEPLYLVEADGDAYRALLPLMEVRSWLTGRRGVSLPFTDAVEPLGSDPESVRRLLSRAREIGRQRDWRYLEIRGGKSFFPDGPASTQFFRHELALSENSAAVFARFDSPVQRAIRKSEKSAITIEFAQSDAAMREFYGLLCQTRQRHGVPPQPYGFFSQIQQSVLAANLGWVVLARHHNRAVAGGVYFHFARGAIYKFGASDLAFQHLRANNLVMWHAIQRYGAEKFVTLDFGRTSLTNAGLRRFKLGWGTLERTAEYVRTDPKTGAFATASDDSAGWHTRVFNRLPMWVSRRIGALLYPHMG